MRIHRPRRTPVPRSAFAGFRFPPDIIVVAVRWYLRFGLSYRDVEELLADRDVEVDHVTIYRWVQRFTPLLAEAARPCRHAVGDQWQVDETYVKVGGGWRYVYRAIDQFGQVVDVFVSPRRDATAARQFFERAIGSTRVHPVEVVTDRAPTYLGVLAEVLPAVWHRTDQYANNRVEADHGRLKAWLRPMRGLKQDRSARVLLGGHAFVQNVRRGHYELAVDEPAGRRLAVTFGGHVRRARLGDLNPAKAATSPCPAWLNATVSIGEAVREARCQDPTPVPRYDPNAPGARVGCLGAELSAVVLVPAWPTARWPDSSPSAPKGVTHHSSAAR